MADRDSLKIQPARVAGILGIIVVLLVIANVFLQYHKLFVQHGVLSYTFPNKFDLDRETTVPAYFSALLLLGVAALLASIARDKRGERYKRHWVALAVVFLFMSIDEASGFHELLIKPLRTKLDAGGVLYLAWVIPGAILVLVFALSYLRFLFHLPNRFRMLFIASGFLYVGGALGMELVGGQYADSSGAGDMTYVLITTAEEMLEMVGLVLFIYALLAYKGLYGRPIHLQIVEPSERGASPPAPDLASPLQHREEGAIS